MRSGSVPAVAWCLAVFLVCELVVAALVAFYIVYPCSWPLSVMEACLPQNHSSVCPDPPCLRKCCPQGEELARHPDPGQFHSVCIPTPPENSSFSLEFVPLWGNDSWNENNYTQYSIISIGLCPNNMYALNNSNERDRHVIQADGTLLMVQSMKTVPMSRFCVDAYRGRGTTSVFKCFPPANSAPVMSELEKTVYPSTWGLDLPFLMATAAVYLLLPKLRNLHGRCLLCHVFGLIVGSFFLALVQINIHNLNTDHSRLCELFAFVIQFSFLATFFWLNVMCFDIWWIFSGLKPLRGSAKERDHKKFILYSLYAWGGPLLILAISLFMETASFVPDSYIKPRFGVDKCWFKDWDALVLYFYLPIGVLILLNIVMFMTTAFRLRAHTKETKVLKSSESRRTDENERQRFNLYLKLFIVMGINWVMELVSFAVGGPKYIWFLTDIGNTLQGLLIFLIFVWKRRILRMLNQKLCPQWQLVGPASSSARSKVSESRTSSLTLSKTHSTNPEGVALKPLPQTTVSEDSDTNM